MRGGNAELAPGGGVDLFRKTRAGVFLLPRKGLIVDFTTFSTKELEEVDLPVIDFLRRIKGFSENLCLPVQ